MFNKKIVNSREDLDSIARTEGHAQFMQLLKGSMSYKKNVAVYPSNYGTPAYNGPVIDPVFEDVEDLSTIERFGFTKEDFENK